MRKPTLRDVAKSAGVHAATVSRALNPETRSLVNEETARRVNKAAKALGYEPNPIARSLKTSRSRTVGLVIPDLLNPLFPPIVRGIESALQSKGYNLWIVSTDNDDVRERALVESLRSRQVDGLIIATARLDHPLLEELQRQGTCMVLINRRSPKYDIPSVTADDSDGILLAVQHLSNLGHRRIVHLAGPQNTSTGVTRLRAFHHAIRDLGLNEDPRLVVQCADWRESHGAEALRGLLDQGPDFTGVVAGNDLLALGCYDVFAERGIDCPRDISVVGFNDMIYLDKMAPPLTSIRVPHFDLGAEAGSMLLDYLAEPERGPRSVHLPVSVTVRGSTAVARNVDPVCALVTPKS